MMRADYDSKADTIEIELEAVARLDHGEPVEGGAAIVHIHDGRPAIVDVIGARNGFQASLGAVAERYELDAEALIAVAHAALAAPDRPVRLDVGVRVVA